MKQKHQAKQAESTRDRIKRVGTAVLMRVAHTGIPEVMLIATLVCARYLPNLDFNYPSELVAPILLLGLPAFGAYYLYHRILGRIGAAHVAALLTAYGMFAFQRFGSRVGWLADWLTPQALDTIFSRAVIVLLVLMIGSLVLGYCAGVLFRHKLLRPLQPTKILLFFIVFLFASQMVRVSYRLIEIQKELRYRHTAVLPNKTGATVSTPDIYYIVADRYANSTTLKQVYGHDNSSFTGFLEQQGFVVREDAYANYPFTMSSITSTLALDYHTDYANKFGSDGFQTAFPYREIFKNPAVAQVLRQNGYEYNQVSSWWDFSRVDIAADTHPTQSFELRLLGVSWYQSDLARGIINDSILSPFLKKGLTVGSFNIVKYDKDDNPYQNFDKQMAALKDISATSHEAPQFTFAHILSPHDPYIFNADGTPTTYDQGRNDNGVDEHIKYTNQLRYLNTRLQETLAVIRAKSPDAVIVLQADEGPYPKEFRFELSKDSYYDPSSLSDDAMRQKFGVLSAVYYPGVSQEDARKYVVSSVNALRFPLARYLGYDLPSLPNCNFSTGDKFVVYKYQLVTERLTGQPADGRCSQL